MRWEIGARETDPDGLHDAKIKVCTDLVLDKVRNTIFVLCVSPAQDPPKPDADTSFVIVELDPKTNNEKSRTTGSASLRFPRLRLANLRNKNSSITTRERFLFVYDQGKESETTQQNKFLVVFNNTSGQPLKLVGRADMVFESIQLSFLSGVYESDGYLILSGKNFNEDDQTPPSWVLRRCWLETNNTLKANCTAEYALPADRIEQGFIGFASSGLYVEIGGIKDQQQTVKACYTGARFDQRSFIQKPNCQILNVDNAFNNMMVGSITANDRLLVVNFIDYFGWHYGSAVYSFALKKIIYGAPAYGNLSIPLERSHLVLTTANVTVYLHTFSYLNVKSTTVGKTTYTIECWDKDSEQQPALNKLELEIYSLTREDKDSRALNPLRQEYPILAATVPGSLYWRIDLNTFIGNNIPLKIGLKDAALLANYNFKYWATAEIVFEGTTRTPDSKIVTTKFAGRFAVSLDSEATLIFYECAQHLQQEETAHLTHCTEKATRKLNNTKCKLHVGASQVGSWVHFWSTDPVNKNSQIYMFSTLPQIYQIGFDQGEIKSFAMSQVRSNLYFAMVFGGPNPIIESRYVRVYTYFDMMYLGALNKASSAREFFCPDVIGFSQTEPHVLEVLSKCPEEKVLLRYEYPPRVDYNGNIEPRLISISKLDIYEQYSCIGSGQELVWYQKIGKFSNEYILQARKLEGGLTNFKVRPPISMSQSNTLNE